jgi:hypothetical protein
MMARINTEIFPHPAASMTRTRDYASGRDSNQSNRAQAQPILSSYVRVKPGPGLFASCWTWRMHCTLTALTGRVGHVAGRAAPGIARSPAHGRMRNLEAKVSRRLASSVAMWLRFAVTEFSPFFFLLAKVLVRCNGSLSACPHS